VSKKVRGITTQHTQEYGKGGEGREYNNQFEAEECVYMVKFYKKKLLISRFYLYLVFLSLIS
jgi:hypothetical protein